jgi:Tetratricopeptide repeat
MHDAEARMSVASKLVALCCLVLAVNSVKGQNSPSVIRGTLSDNGTPIAEATIFLQSFDDETCAKLFTTGKEDPKSAGKLESCMHDVSTSSPDAAGSYKFTDPRAGWYAVHFLWNIGKKPSQSMYSFSQGRWTGMYAGHRDSTGRYDTMAQDTPFYFSAKEDVTRDFDMPVAQQPKPLRGRLSLAAKDWGVVLDLPGFAVRTVETKPDGRRYMVAENEATKVVVSLTVEDIKSGAHGSSCRESLEKKTKNTELKILDVRFSRSGDVDVLRYMVPEFRGQPVKQESLFACQSYDNTYIDLQVSKSNYTAADEPLFADVLESMRIDKVQKSSMELAAEGSRLYIQHDYKGAIGPYSQALELEKVNPKLEKPLWYVLVDNLGMSYGITGDLQKAKETFQYGVNKDPTYPIFYYNLACTYAELGDTPEARDYLKKAFEYKANVLPGENIPDPRRDDSFKKLMKNKEFQELAETLARLR